MVLYWAEQSHIKKMEKFMKIGSWHFGISVNSQIIVHDPPTFPKMSIASRGVNRKDHRQRSTSEKSKLKQTVWLVQLQSFDLCLANTDGCAPNRAGLFSTAQCGGWDGPSKPWA